MPGSPFFFGDDGGDQMANSGTWLDLLRQKLPAAFDATAAPPPMNANGAARPTAPVLQLFPQALRATRARLQTLRRLPAIINSHG